MAAVGGGNDSSSKWQAASSGAAVISRSRGRKEEKRYRGDSGGRLSNTGGGQIVNVGRMLTGCLEYWIRNCRYQRHNTTEVQG
jgi:hypothetical protein